MSAGQLNHIVIGKETTWGTPVVPATTIPANFTGGITTNQDIQTVDPMKATLAKTHNTYVGARVHEGEIEVDFYPDTLGLLFGSALGGVASAQKGGETVVYEHTLTEAETKLAMTVEQKIGENIRRYAGVQATGFTISGQTGETVTATFPVIAKSNASASAVTPSPTTVRPFNYKDVTVKIDTVAIGEVRSFEITYANNSEFLHALNGSNDPAYRFVKGSEVSGKLELYLNSTSLTQYTNYLAKTEIAIDLEITGNETIGTASNYKFTLNIPKATITTAETPITEDYNLVTIDFIGRYDPASSKLLSGVLTNLTSSY